jgi:hypothetical protein
VRQNPKPLLAAHRDGLVLQAGQFSRFHFVFLCGFVSLWINDSHHADRNR